MSGVQGGGCRFSNVLNLLMNFERPTTYQYDMPYVVADVVPYVEGRSKLFPEKRKFEIGKSQNLKVAKCESANPTKITTLQIFISFEDRAGN
jgi:hypothetical protein